jgi:hypothetical protein
VNQNGGMYVRGKAYDLLKKLQVAEAYIKKKEGGERRPNLKRIASECGVSWAFVSKIEQEILVHERVWFRIHKQSNDGEEFFATVKRAAKNGLPKV